MKLNEIHTHDYTLIADGNGGEEQLVITNSFGQDGYAALTIVQASVDGGCTVLHSGRVRSDDVSKVIRTVIKHWDKPNAMGDDSTGNVDRIVAAFEKLNEIR